MKKLIYGTLFLALIGMGGCKKVNENLKGSNSSLLQSPSNIELRVYNNSADFYEEVNNLLAMNHEERVQYENGLGYVSFGRRADEIYLASKPETLTDEEIKAYEIKNKDYTSINEKDGELYFETVYGDNPFRYVMDFNRMFQIGNKVYKVFNEGFVIAEKTDINSLKNYNPVKLKESSTKFIISLFEKDFVVSKDVVNNCGLSFSGSQTNGVNRTVMSISSWISYDNSPVIGNFNVIRNEFLIRPYKKTLGIWYYCIRTISYDVKLAVDIRELNNIWAREFAYKSGTKSDSKIQHLLSGRLTLGWTPPTYHFGGSKSFGDTPSTNPVNLNCNTHLF